VGSLKAMEKDINSIGRLQEIALLGRGKGDLK